MGRRILNRHFLSSGFRGLKVIDVLPFLILADTVVIGGII